MTVAAKRIAWIVAALTGAALLLLVVRPSPVSVETARAARGAMRLTVDEEGKTRVRERFVLSAPVAGRLTRIELHEGDPIERGSVLARLAPLPLDERTRAEARARLLAATAAERAAQARVQRAQAALEQAKRSHIRADQLAAKGTLAPEERELAEGELTRLLALIRGGAGDGFERDLGDDHTGHKPDRTIFTTRHTATLRSAQQSVTIL